MLYLSHDIPGMETLESLYVFIWEQIRLHRLSSAEVKSAVLFDLYGKIENDDLKNVGLTKVSERNLLWSRLIEKKVIDSRGRLLIATLNELEPSEWTKKLIFYIRGIIQRQRRIRIPEQLLPLVDRHLDTYIANARRASFELKPGEHYVVDYDRSSADLTPRVVIIDPDTGTDQIDAQWDGALHQFLQLKEGCKLTLQSLKAVFISNVTYIRKYRSLVGLSGTLGSEGERHFLEKMYNSSYLIVPTAFPRRSVKEPAAVFMCNEQWMQAIVQEVCIKLKKNRSLLIVCESINQVNRVYQTIIKQDATLEINNKIHCYTRDYEKFAFEQNELEAGHVIVATNLAGRGTDIKLSTELKQNGGLHVCLTYLPKNLRIEQQVMGRSGRQGSTGSGRLILFYPEDKLNEIKESFYSVTLGGDRSLKNLNW